MNKEKITGYFLIILAVGFVAHSYGTGTTDLKAGSLQDSCKYYASGECQDWVYDNSDKLQPASTTVTFSDRKVEKGFLEPLLFGAGDGVKGTCLETQNGVCVRKKLNGEVYVKVVDNQNELPTAGIFDTIGGWLGGGSDDSSSDSDSGVDVEVGDETEVETDDGTTVVDSDDDTDNDGWVDEGEADFDNDGNDQDADLDDGTDSDTDTDDSDSDSGSDCGWFCFGSGDDEDNEPDEPVVEETYYKCGGEVYTQAVPLNEGEGLTGYEKKIKVTEWSDGDVEEETVRTVDSFDIGDGELPKVCVEPTDETAKFVDSYTEVRITTLLGRIGIIP